MNGENVLNYINNVSQTDANNARENSYKMSDIYINKIANDYGTAKKEECARDMVTGIYKDALPNNLEIRDRSEYDMNNFINDQCPDGLYKYITDSRNCALKDSCKECSNAVDEACNDMRNTLKKCVKESNMPVSDSDIEFAKNKADADVKNNMEHIARRGSFPELSEAISNNVTNAVRSSVEGAKETKRANAEFEKDLKSNLSLTTKESVDTQVVLMNNKARKDYTLFEAIFASKMGMVTTESAEDIAGCYNDLNANERVMLETVAEYTKHSVWKALRLKNYDITTTKNIIHDYLAM